MKTILKGLIWLSVFVGLTTQGQPPSFFSNFSPSTIGPGSSSVLTYTISNFGTGASDITFTNTLPAGVSIANPANIVFTEAAGTVTAPDGGSTITFSGGVLAPNASMTIQVNVTSSTAGTHINTTGDLTSSLGNGGSASANLTVSSGVLGFSHSFNKTSILIGEKATLTYAFDNSANSGSAVGYGFTTNLPSTLVLANPVNIVNSCPNTNAGNPTNVLLASVGGSVISMQSFSGSGYTPPNSSCTISVDVIGVSAGTEILRTDLFGDEVGIGIDEIEVKSNIANGILFSKQFSSDILSPGELSQLSFTISNLDRTDPLTAITFTDDLDDMLSGMTSQGLPMTDVCGSGSTLSDNGSGLLTLSGGTIAAEGSCTFSVNVLVPNSAASGSYTNTTSAVSGTRNGSGVTGPVAQRTVKVYGKPMLTKEIVPKPVAIDGSVVFRYTLENTDLLNTITDITFVDNVNGVAPNVAFPFYPSPPQNFCGTGSIMFPSDEINDGTSGIKITGANLLPGASCTFEVTGDLNSNILGGNYFGEITRFTGNINSVGLTGKATNDTLKVSPVPKLTKSFSDPGLPGDTLSLEYVFTLDGTATQPFSGIMFSDDFSAVSSGSSNISLIITEIESSLCTGATITGLNTNTLSFSNGSLSPGDTCRFSIKVKIPNDSPMGRFNSSTSAPTNGSFTGVAASSGFDVIGLIIQKEYSEPTFPGDQMTMTYSFINPHPTSDIMFSSGSNGLTDKLNDELSGLSYAGGNRTAFCGGASSLSGTTSLSINNVTVPPADTCKLNLVVTLPTNTGYQSYQTALDKPDAFAQNSGTIPGNQNSIRIVNGSFEVLTPIEFSKTFLSNGNPEDTVLLEFKIKNLHLTETMSSISFTDDLSSMYSGFTAIELPQNNIVGAGSSLSGNSVISLTSGSLIPGATATFQVKVKVPADIYSGIFENVTSDISFQLNGNSLVFNPAKADLVVNNNRRPTFRKSFSKDTVLTGETLTLTFVVDNSLNVDEVTSFSFSDNLPEGMVISATPNISNSCTSGSVGTVTGNIGASIFSVNSGSVGASSTCTYSVDIRVDKSQSLINISEELLSNVGTSGTAKDTVFVKMPEPASFTAAALNYLVIDLSATANANNSDSILVAFSLDGVFGEPMGNLNSGDNIAGGGKVFFKGLASDLTRVAMGGLTQSTKYYFKAWSYGYDLYSVKGLLSSDTTFVNPNQVFGINASQLVNCVGSSTKLTVDTILNVADYQWQVKLGGVGSFSNVGVSTKYPKVDSSTLTITNLSLTDNANEYRCIIYTKGTKDTTSNYVLSVHGNPVVSMNPKDSSNCAGSDFLFFVKAVGPGLTYQWQKRIGSAAFVNISGAEDDTLSLTNVQFSDDSTFYRCVITGTCGLSISDSAILRAPLQPTLLAGTAVNPSTCLGTDGSIPFTSTNLPDGVYSLSFASTGTSSPQNVTVSGNAFTLSNISSGTYSNFSVTYLGCTYTSSDVVTLNDPVFIASASNSGPYQESDQINLFASNGVSFDWSGPDGFMSSLQNPSIPSGKTSNAGVYTSIITSGNNCTVTATTMVNIQCTTSSVTYFLAYAGANHEIIGPLVEGMEVQESSRAMTVYGLPNCTLPTIESIKFQLSGTSNLQFHIDNKMPFYSHEVDNVATGDFLAPNLYTFIARAYDQDDAQGNVLIGPDGIQFWIVQGNRQISQPVLPISEACIGSSFVLSMSVSGDYKAGNFYKAYLSDKDGNFGNPVLIGDSDDPTSIDCTIPNYIKGGIGYKVMVISTAPIVSSMPSITSLKIISSDLSLESPSDDILNSNGDRKAINIIHAENKIQGTSNIEYQAGRNIQLKPGFESQNGATFKAGIVPMCPE